MSIEHALESSCNIGLFMYESTFSYVFPGQDLEKGCKYVQADFGDEIETALRNRDQDLEPADLAHQICYDLTYACRDTDDPSQWKRRPGTEGNKPKV